MGSGTTFLRRAGSGNSRSRKPVVPEILKRVVGRSVWKAEYALRYTEPTEPFKGDASVVQQTGGLQEYPGFRRQVVLVTSSGFLQLPADEETKRACFRMSFPLILFLYVAQVFKGRRNQVQRLQVFSEPLKRRVSLN